MKTAALLEDIAQKDFDVDAFVQMVVNDEAIRDEIVYQMISNPAIMVYYHCYYVVAKASQKHPALFYPYWDEIAALLQHSNSYHRDFGLTIIGNLSKVDQQNRFSAVEGVYFARMNDEKFMTGNCCVQNIAKIYRHKPDLRDHIIALFLDVENQCDYAKKQLAVLKYDVLALFDAIREAVPQKTDIDTFIRAEVHSISPKTRKKAKEMVKKYRL